MNSFNRSALSRIAGIISHIRGELDPQEKKIVNQARKKALQIKNEEETVLFLDTVSRQFRSRPHLGPAFIRWRKREMKESGITDEALMKLAEKLGKRDRGF
ncbi:MAG: hypothetical protein ACLFQB_10530 [Chitinispirillaceae bacterium]